MARRFLALIALLMTAAAAYAWSQSTPQAARPSRTAQVEATAVFAGGCFWCTESDFDKMPGVRSTVSGYTGGRSRAPTYEQVSAGNSGHIEVVRVVYDPRRISYSSLVSAFLKTVDPTDGGGQFCDRGDQYRPAIFVANAEERRIAEAALAAASRQIGKPLATAVLPRAPFWRAEEYHQDYYKKNPVRYRFYRWNCGRDARIAEVWRARR